MLSTQKRHDFVRMRADGKSFRQIQEELGISRTTCSAWAHELEAEVAVCRSENLASLYQEYGLTKEARIKRLGKMVQRIEDALDAADLSQVPPAKLLELHAKYCEALKAEYSGADDEPLPVGADRASDANLFYLYSDLIDRLRAGTTTAQQARVEMEAYSRMRASYSTATTEYDIWGNTGEKELEPPIDAYDQLGDGAAATRRAALEAEEARQRAETEEPKAREPSISMEDGVAAMKGAMARLVQKGDAEGLIKILQFAYSTDDEDDE